MCVCVTKIPIAVQSNDKGLRRRCGCVNFGGDGTNEIDIGSEKRASRNIDDHIGHCSDQ